MKVLANCMILLMILCQKTEAASAPLSHPSSLSDTAKQKSFLLHPSIVHAPYKKAGFIRKLQYRLALKSLKHFSVRINDDAPSKKNPLSTISLILGVVGAVALFIPSIAGAAVLIAGPAALITGILAHGKRHNNTKASRTKATIGLILGAVLIFLLVIAVILIAGSGWGFLLFM